MSKYDRHHHYNIILRYIESPSAYTVTMRVNGVPGWVGCKHPDWSPDISYCISNADNSIILVSEKKEK